MIQCLTVFGMSWLSVMGSLWNAFTLFFGTLALGVLFDERLLGGFSVFRSCCLDWSSPEREHCLKFFLRWCGRLLRQAGGFRKSGTKALCPFLCHPPKESLTDKHVLAFCVACSLSESEEMANMLCKTEELRLWECCLGLGCNMRQLARLLCCGLLNIIQYGGQDGTSPDDEEYWGWCWLMKPLCSPVSTQFSRLNSYCQMDKEHIKELNNHCRLLSLFTLSKTNAISLAGRSLKCWPDDAAWEKVIGLLSLQLTKMSDPHFTKILSLSWNISTLNWKKGPQKFKNNSKNFENIDIGAGNLRNISIHKIDSVKIINLLTMLRVLLLLISIKNEFGKCTHLYFMNLFYRTINEARKSLNSIYFQYWSTNKSR